MERTKVCLVCRVEKRLRHFYKQPKGVMGRKHICKPCYSDYYKHPERRELHRVAKARLYYGLTREQLTEILRRQGGVCALCRLPFDNTRFRGQAIDHDHRTGLVRGIIHARCNSGLGFFEDDIELLRLAVAYLQGCHS